MILFFYVAPIALIILLLLYDTSILKKNKINHIVFVILFNVIFVSYCCGAYKICQYASDIRLNGKIKIYLNSLLQNQEDSILFTAPPQTISVFPGSNSYFLLLSGTIVLFLIILILLYFSFHKNYLRYTAGILSLFCMFLIFIVFEKSLNYYNNYYLYIEAQKISNIIARNNQKGMKASLLHNKLRAAISKFNAPYYYGETPISRLKMLQEDMMTWNNPKTEHPEKPLATRLDNPKAR